MGIDFIKAFGVGAINPNINSQNKRVSFGNSADSFQTTSPLRYTSEEAIKHAINTNPNIKNILKEMNAPVKLNMKELNNLLDNHAKTTQNIATEIINNLPKGLKEQVNIKSVKEACLLHDVGKVLIPTEILNKPEKLTSEEQKIMHRHSELGYEILKNTDIDTRTLNLIKYHHQNANHNGYPSVKKDFFADINLQILSVSDKFSALTEERPYKTAIPDKQALGIVYKDVENGNLHPFIFKALYNYVNANNIKQPTEVL